MPQVSNKKESFFKNVKLYNQAHAYTPNTQTDTQEAKAEDHEFKTSLDFLATSCQYHPHPSPKETF